jgi:hypothetical protein
MAHATQLITARWSSWPARKDILLLPTLFPTLSGVGTKCFSSCCDKDSAIIFTTGRLPDVNPALSWSEC